MEMYDADDVAVALNTLFANVVAPLIANHPEAEALYDRLEEAVEDAEGNEDPAVSLSRMVVGNLLDAVRREREQKSRQDRRGKKGP